MKDRVRLAEGLSPDETDEALPAARETQPDDAGSKRCHDGLAGRNPPGTDTHRSARDEEGAGSRRATRRGTMMAPNLADEEVEIDPDEDEDDTGHHGEEPEPDEQRTPEHRRIADRLEPVEAGEPMRHEKSRQDQRHQQQEHQRGGEKTEEWAHDVAAISMAREPGRPFWLSGWPWPYPCRYDAGEGQLRPKANAPAGDSGPRIRPWNRPVRHLGGMQPAGRWVCRCRS